MKKFLDNALSSAIKRRTFIKWGAATGSAAVLAGNALPLKAIAADATPAPQEKVTWTACMVNCGSRCPLQVHTKDGVITHVESDNRGADIYGQHQIRACLRGRSIKQRVYNTDRLKYPMKRVGKRGEGRFERISWDEALDIVAKQLKYTLILMAMMPFTSSTAPAPRATGLTALMPPSVCSICWAAISTTTVTTAGGRFSTLCRLLLGVAAPPLSAVIPVKSPTLNYW